ncbi:hypothetical protein ACFLZO_00325 [Patescibacteria group bacterium]
MIGGSTMNAHFSHTIRRDRKEETDLENIRACVILAQDQDREYVYCWGRAYDVGRLFVWGSLNWGFASPPSDLVSAIHTTLDPLVREGDTKVIEHTVPTDLFTFRQEHVGKGPWTMDVRVFHGAAHSVDLHGLTDGLFFIMTTDGEMKLATGGSGMQKSKLLELGILEIFGERIAAAFKQAYYGDRHPIVESLHARALEQTRKRGGGKPPGISVGVISFDPSEEDDTEEH